MEKRNNDYGNQQMVTLVVSIINKYHNCVNNRYYVYTGCIIIFERQACQEEKLVLLGGWEGFDLHIRLYI